MSREMQTIIVRKLLHELRILPNKKGYEYIVEAVSIAIDNSDKIRGGKNLIGIYDEVAEKFERTYSNVERCIRYAIRSASENPSEKMLTLFPYLPAIPTNSAFISVLAEHLAFQSEGEWIDQHNGKYSNPIYVCSQCRKGTLLRPHINELDNMEMAQALSPFCPNCGAKMKGGAE